MTKTSASLVAILSGMIALPDFSGHSRSVELDGQTRMIQYCIRALPSPETELGTVLGFIENCPHGWLPANGEYIRRELYPELYAVLEALAPPEMQAGAQR